MLKVQTKFGLQNHCRDIVKKAIDHDRQVIPSVQQCKMTCFFKLSSSLFTFVQLNCCPLSRHAISKISAKISIGREELISLKIVNYFKFEDS